MVEPLTPQINVLVMSMQGANFSVEKINDESLTV